MTAYDERFRKLLHEAMDAPAPDEEEIVGVRVTPAMWEDIQRVLDRFVNEHSRPVFYITTEQIRAMAKAAGVTEAEVWEAAQRFFGRGNVVEDKGIPEIAP